MQSSLGWIDFSSLDREKLRNVLSLLSDPGMVDELGIGSIRDSFSDALFPGISTIQTRAKYFLTIPRIIRDFEGMTDSHRRRVGGLMRYLLNQEDECARLFAKPFENKPDTERSNTGIIGISALDAGVLRKPSEIYWGGLRTFGVVRTRLSRTEFCRLLDQPSHSIRSTIKDSDKEKGDDQDAVSSSSLVRIPSADSEWRQNLSIELTAGEAEFLLHQMNQPQISGSLFSELLQDEVLRKLFIDENLRFFDLPDLLVEHLSSGVHDLLRKAVAFWDILEGAHIRYNCLLQRSFGIEEKKLEFDEKWETWCERIDDFNWNDWDISFLWSLANETGHHVRTYTKTFVETWCNEVCLGLERKGTLDYLDELVSRQEKNNKGKKSRLIQKDISVRQWIGIDNLTYRYPQVRRIVRDLQEGVDCHA